jgi:hypothetical protein
MYLEAAVAYTMPLKASAWPSVWGSPSLLAALIRAWSENGCASWEVVLRGEGAPGQNECLPFASPFFRALPARSQAPPCCVLLCCVHSMESQHSRLPGNTPELLDALLCSVQNPANLKLDPALDKCDTHALLWFCEARIRYIKTRTVTIMVWV